MDAIYYLEKGKEQLYRKDFEGALLQFVKAIDLDTKSCEAHFFEGFAKRELLLYEESITSFDNALAIDPSHCASLMQKSYSLCALNEYEKALLIVDKLIESNPDWYTYMQRASIKDSLEDFEGAELDRASAWKIGHCFSIF